MRLLTNPNFDFLGKRKIAAGLSSVMIFTGLLSLLLKGGPALSIDFTGGTLVQVQFAQPVDVGTIRDLLLAGGFTSPTIQRFGEEDEILIRVSTEEAGENFSQRLGEVLEGWAFEIRRLESVGPKIGGELRGEALRAIFFAMLGILIYITLRFDRYYALGAVIALFHDVIVTLGIFSLLGLEINLAIVAAFLTIVGYSLNDTIVVFDRVRENLRVRRKETFFAVVNQSINQTLSRTIITSGTTLMVVSSLYILGGEVIKYFAFALIIGVLVGTYSSIYVASPLVAFLEQRAQAKTG